jgi:glycosyltransferase involved in cell wall biosynthesis
MNENVLISVCVPAYKRPENVRRLLQSLVQQTFTDFEVIITDDSPDNSVFDVLPEFSLLPIKYFKNTPALGTPTNWNCAISKASGQWIKVMHDDDWFSAPNSLQLFAEATEAGKAFIFSYYQNVLESGEKEFKAFPEAWRARIVRNPVNLLAYNVIGPPSVVMVKKGIKHTYDERLKWRVDIDFYIRLLKESKNFEVIKNTLINVGISESQVTNSCINQPQVELPEGLLLLEKYGTQPLNDLYVYDAWWRILRNVGVRSEQDLLKHTPGKQWPTVIKNMVAHQRQVPISLLRNGFVSKPAMFLSYLRNKNSIYN